MIQPLGFLYGSAGGFLSPENLVGCSRAKFPPDAATVSGLLFSANKVNAFASQIELRENLYVAGPFWARENSPQFFYVPIPWTKIITEKTSDEWKIKEDKWQRDARDLKPNYSWQQINSWDKPAQLIKSNRSMSETPWKFVPILHPRMKKEERHSQEEDGLFLENAVQMSDEVCLVYLSTHELPDGWYRFGGENHLVEIKSLPISENNPIISLLQQPIERAFALITLGIWGSNRLSYRYPQHSNFPEIERMLTDKAIPYRFRAGGRMGRGRYGVSAGSVYVLKQPLNQSWWQWSEDWFPKEGYSLKRVGCGLCLPLNIQGVN